jgi:hypothetical protein
LVLSVLRSPPRPPVASPLLPRPVDRLAFPRDSFEPSPVGRSHGDAVQSLARALSAMLASIFEELDPERAARSTRAPVSVTRAARPAAISALAQKLDLRQQLVAAGASALRSDAPPSVPFFDASGFDAGPTAAQLRQISRLLGSTLGPAANARAA